MQVYTNSNSAFPDQVVPEAVKRSYDYGLQVGRAVEGEWFWAGRGGSRFSYNYNSFFSLRLYARGEQSVQKYKDEMSINGDLSYLNLDWKPVPVIPKFVDIVVNGISSRNYNINAFAQDPASMQKRTKYAEELYSDMKQKELISTMQQKLGINVANNKDPEIIPADEAEFEVHMQMSYKQAIEMAEEELINNVFSYNKYDLTSQRVSYDLTVLGIGATKTSFNKSEGIRVEYVDPANLVYSYTEDPNFEDLYYVGEVKNLHLADVKKQFPNLTNSQLEEIQKYPGNTEYVRNWNGRQDNNTVQVLFFEYKTYTDQVFKLKYTDNGLEKILQKPDTFNPPESDNFKRVSRSIETLYSGAKILGLPLMLDWKQAENITRPFGNTVKVNMNYNICAPRMFKGRIESLVSRITGFADMIQLTSLKLQQVLSRVVPDGVFVDVDGLAEVDLGNGTNYNAAEALNMYFQTGSIVGRSMTQDGDLNHGKVPIQELQASGSQAKIQSLIQTYEYYLKMIRDVTGLNEARDGSSPDPKSLVGIQKLAAANSNTATRHILQAFLYITLRNAENVALRSADAIMFPLTREALLNSISKYNVKTLDELLEKNYQDFGIYLELEPDEEEKAMLEQNIQMALQQNQIYLEDAIDIREINNIQLANAFLKIKRKQKQKQDQEAQQANIKAQAEANAKAAEQAAMAEVQKQQAISETNVQFEQAKSQMELQRMQTEAEIKKQMLEIEFNYDMKLERMRVQAMQEKENRIENRKDRRSKIQATQQSQMINQRQTDGLPTNFEVEEQRTPQSNQIVEEQVEIEEGPQQPPMM